MAVKFHVIERGQPGVPGGGVKKFYASHVSKSELTIEELTTFIEKESTVSGADIRAVLYALVDVIVNGLSDGEVIRLGDLGSLHISVSSEGKATADEVNAKCIKGSKVNFTPGTRIKEMQKTLKFQKV